MTVKRISTRTEVTGRIPFFRKRREVEVTTILRPGFSENVVVTEENLSQSNGPSYYRHAFELEVLSEDSVRLTPRISGSVLTIGQQGGFQDDHPWNLEKDHITWFLGPPNKEYKGVRTDPKRGPSKEVKFEWEEPTLSPQERK